MSGVFAVARAVFDHAVFANEPYSEREAWIWLIGEAAWKPCRVRAGRAVVDLDRGQLAHSTRFMATKWGWSEARVRRFLSRLVTATMINVKTDALATQITICKYNDYQKVGLPSDAEATQRRRSSDAEKKQLNSEEEDTSSLRSDVRARTREPSPRDELNTVLDEEHAVAVVEHRRSLRKPLSSRAAKLLARKFARCPDPNGAADAMIANGWQGFEPEWMENKRGNGNGNGQAYYNEKYGVIVKPGIIRESAGSTATRLARIRRQGN